MERACRGQKTREAEDNFCLANIGILDELMFSSAFVLTTSVQPEAVSQLKITNDNSEYREQAYFERD